ncbi:MAG: response regulator [Spirochaetales bacterium]|jgi:signal transduction histidine kinase/CheY-like chemotaxis protein|nr:response regulator [Spirochaetales bacterium]
MPTTVFYQKRKELLFAERATLLSIFAYMALTTGYSLYFLPQMQRFPLRITCYVLFTAVLLYIRRKNGFHQSIASWLVPSAFMAIETTVSLLTTFGNRFYFLFLLNVAVISFTYFYPRGFLIYLGISNVFLMLCTFVFDINLLVPGFLIYHQVMEFLVYDLVCILLYACSRFMMHSNQAIAKSGLTFETIMDTTTSHMVTINENAEVEYISASLANWLGFSQRQYTQNRPLLDLFSSGEMLMMIQDVMEQSDYVEKNFEIVIDGKQYWFMLRSSPLTEDTAARFFEWMDITPIMEAKNEADSAARAKDDFLTNISHEIRTPMNAIIGMTDLILTDHLEPEQMTRADTIKGAAMSLLNIINDILDFSKLDARKMEIIPRFFDFSSLINDTVNMISVKASTAGLALTLFISKDIPPLINTDELRLKQCLINILNNAVKFTRKGFIHMRVWAETLETGDLKLNFSVQDTGIGIKKQDLEKLFIEFQQLDTHKNRNIEGTGLGLAITRRLVELMGGGLTVESVYGEGTNFSFYVICKGRHQGKLVEIEQPQSMRVLCYEPHPYNARSLRDMLESLHVAGNVCVDLDKLKTLLSAGGFTHVFFDISAKETLREFFVRNGTRFILLKEVPEKYDSDIPNALNRPILITSFADVLNGKKSYEKRRKKRDEVPMGSFMTKDVRILVVDDNPVNLKVAEGLLRRYGITVDTVPGGQEAIAKIKIKDYDIIFMDHMMPGMDGLDTTRAIRSMGSPYDSIIIIALTANAVSGVQEQFLESGMDDFLSKPIIIRDLRDLLKKHLPPEKIIST